MSLGAGVRLGPYEIVAPLGAGGMGEVYRATDSRLNRTVAIKILSDESAADADRRERFEREAKAISALDHPNICPLYDVGEQEGTYFLVMPCLEGQTLADRLAKGALPPDQAIKYAIEIATALDAAHRHGIIHRDLKPGNIMLTKTGVKLLDFGLAKLKKASGPLTYSGMANLAGNTTQATGTGIGTLLGTMPYMAPEQVEGREVDARSDIFSLGAVIYEMVTGQRAFKGDSPASVIGAILKDEPPLLTTVKPLTPAALDHVVSTCLAKDPDERWQSAADIARELKWVAQAPGESGAVGSRVSPTSQSRRASFAAGFVIALVTSVAIGVLAWPFLQRAATPPDIVRFPLAPPPNSVFTPTRSSVPIMQVAVSPNGRHLAFAASERGKGPMLWIRTLDDAQARALSGTQNGGDPFWSPDSQHVGFFADGRLKRVELSSGSVQDICEASLNSRGASWSSDGTIVFGDAATGLRKVAATGGPVAYVTTVPPGENSHRWPWFLPDGRRFLYFARGEAQKRGIYVGALDGTAPVQLMESAFSAIYANGHLLTVRDGTLLAFPFDTNSLQLTDQPLTIASTVAGSSTQQAPFSASTNGVLSWGGALQDQTELTWFDRTGTMLASPVQIGSFVNFRLSPNQSTLAVTRIDQQTNTSDIWQVDLERGISTRMTLDRLNDMGPVWSPDGRSLVFRSDRAGGNFLFSTTAGSGNRETLLLKRETSNPTDWSPDGKYLLFHNTVATTGIDISSVNMAGDMSITPIVQTRFDEFDARLSSDGRWFAYTSDESGRSEVYVQAFPPTGTKWTVSAQGGAEPRWRHDGRELFYLAPDRSVMSVAIDAGATFKAGVPRRLFTTRTPTFGNPYRTNLEVTADGRRFLINVGPDAGASSPVNVVVNWTTALQRK